jgi:hypothetical protein
MHRVKTMKGKTLDLTPIMAKKQNTVAIGNANMNARGDILGPGGAIVKRREEVMQEYHNANPKAVRRVSLKDVQADQFPTPAEAMAQLKKQSNQKAPVSTPANTAPKSGKRIIDQPDD